MSTPKLSSGTLADSVIWCRIAQGWYDRAKGSVHGTFLQYFDSPANLVAKVSTNLIHGFGLRAVDTD